MSPSSRVVLSNRNKSRSISG